MRASSNIPYYAKVTWTSPAHDRNEWSFFSAWYTQATLRKAMWCHGTRVPSPYLYLYDRGITVIPPSVTVADANARTCNLVDWARGWCEKERVCLCLIGDDEFISVGKAVPFFEGWADSIRMRLEWMIVFLRLAYPSNLHKAMRCHGIRVPSPYMYLYDRGMTEIPTSP